MRDETGSDQLSHHHGQVGGDGRHSVLQVVVQLSSVLCDINHLQKRKKKKVYDITTGGRLLVRAVVETRAGAATVQMR